MRSYPLSLLFLILGLTACSHSAKIEDQVGQSALPALSAIPASPAREVSALQELAGDITVLRGGSFDESFRLPQLTPAPGEISYCIYEFDSSTDYTNSSLKVWCDSAQDAEVWIGVSNYLDGHWTFLPPVAADGTKTVDLPGPRGIYSNGAHTYVAVIANGANNFQILKVSLNLTNPGWRHLYGDDSDNNLLCSASDGQNGMWAAGYHWSDTWTPTGWVFAGGWVSVVHIDSAGNVDQQRLLSSDFAFRPSDIVVDSAGQVYIGGASGGTASHPFIAKLSSQGDLLWAHEYHNTSDRSRWINSLALDASGQLYFVAGGGSEEQRQDRQLAAVGPDGELLWSRFWDNGGYGNPDLECLGDSLFVGDTYTRLDPYGMDGEMLSFDIAGQLLWGKRWDCETSEDWSSDYNESVRVALDNQGRLFWSGSNYVNDNASGLDYWFLSLLAFQPDGTLATTAGYRRAVASYGDPGEQHAAPSGLAFDSAGRLYASVNYEYGGYGQLISFWPDLTPHRAERLSEPQWKNAVVSLYDLDLFSDGDTFLCGSGRELTNVAWEDIDGNSWTPQITVGNFAPVIVDDSVSWTSQPLTVNQETMDYVFDQDNHEEYDQLLIKRSF